MGKRKDHLTKKMRQEWSIMTNRKRFILMMIEDKLPIKKKKRQDVIQVMKDKGFKTMTEIVGRGGAVTDLAKEGSNDSDTTSKKSDFDYLLNMNFWQLTMEKVQELEKQCAEKEKDLAI